MAEPLKNMYNQQFVTDLAAALKKVYPAFDGDGFSVRVFDGDWEARELKDRMRHITTVLHDFLPPDYRTALDILRQVAPLLSDYGFKLRFFLTVFSLQSIHLSSYNQFLQNCLNHQFLAIFIQ